MIDELILPYGWLWVCLFFIFCVIILNGVHKWITAFGLCLSVGLSFWLGYQLNYIRSNDIGIVRTYSNEYIGYITKHPYKDTLTVLTTPKYPILNCPTLSDSQPMCEQELIEIKKSHVISVEFLN